MPIEKKRQREKKFNNEQMRVEKYGGGLGFGNSNSGNKKINIPGTTGRKNNGTDSRSARVDQLDMRKRAFERALNPRKNVSYDGTGYDLSSAGAREEKANIRRSSNTRKKVSYDGTGNDLTSRSAREEQLENRRAQRPAFQKPKNRVKNIVNGSTMNVEKIGEGLGYRSSNSGNQKINIPGTTEKNTADMMREARRKQQEAREIEEYKRQRDQLTRQTVKGNAKQRDAATKKRQAFDEAFAKNHPGVDLSKLDVKGRKPTTAQSKKSKAGKGW